MDYEKAKHYFSQDEKYLPKAIGLGVLGVIMLFASPIVGILVILAAGLVFYINKKKYVTDAEYDTMVREQVEGLKGIALEKLGIDESEVHEIDPITIGGYDFDFANLKMKKGKDDVWRTNRYESVILFFAPNDVHCYSYDFSTTEKKQKESTDVYFYGDIVSASTSSTELELKDSNGNKVLDKNGSPIMRNYESFNLRTSGGTSLQVTISDAEQAKRSINAMRQLLREKKLNS